MALTDVEHVEAVALMNKMLEDTITLHPDIRRGVDRWLREHHPDPTAYMAAMRSLAGKPPEADPDDPTEKLTMIALALKNHGIEEGDPERGVEILIEQAYADRKALESLAASDR